MARSTVRKTTPTPASVHRMPFVSARPTGDEIAQEAYNRYVERGCEDGHDLEDWLAAEESLQQRRTAASA